MSKTVADTIVDYLVNGGVQRAYGIPGDSIDPLVDAIRRNPKLKYIQTRHEEGAAFAASFDSKFNGMPVACFGTSGPGSIHLLNGLYDAKMDKASVIAITGQVERSRLGQDSHQEVNLTKLFDDVSVYNQFISSSENAPYVISRAVRDSVRLKGVSHLNVPFDVFMEKVKDSPSYATKTITPTYFPDLSEAAAAIDASERPVLLIGAGALKESSELADLSYRIGAPIIYALMGKGIFSDSDKRVLGGLGLLGTKPSLEAITKSDLLIEIGSSYPYKQFIPEGIRAIQVDIDAGNFSKVFPVSIPVLSDSHTFIKSILPMVKEKTTKYYEEFVAAGYAWKRELSDLESKNTGIVNPALLAHTLSQETKENAIIVTDTGNTTVWIARHYMAKKGQRFLFSGALASMGNSLPGAIGVAMSTDRQVISAVGDGGFAMTMTELATIRKYNIPVKILLFNNSKLGMIKFEQEVEGYPQWGVDLVNPDFSTIASAYGIESLRISKNSEIASGVKKMFESSGPFLLEAITDPNTRPNPPRITFDQASGYLMASLREKVGYTPEILSR
ncbi:pyruvate dehydrogenase [Thermoplasmatales archaeon]|nr:pyruvate dehydrogenase [Thermoplasmatales archaeon]